jgi:hypothetical protein
MIELKKLVNEIKVVPKIPKITYGNERKMDEFSLMGRMKIEGFPISINAEKINLKMEK